MTCPGFRQDLQVLTIERERSVQSEQPEDAIVFAGHWLAVCAELLERPDVISDQRKLAEFEGVEVGGLKLEWRAEAVWQHMGLRPPSSDGDG